MGERDPNQQRQVFQYGGGEELLRMLAEDIAKVKYPASIFRISTLNKLQGCTARRGVLGC